MGFVFRKSFRVGPVTITLSKTGVGLSLSKGGVRVGINTNGRKTISTNISGTGVTIRKNLNNKK